MKICASKHLLIAAAAYVVGSTYAAAKSGAANTQKGALPSPIVLARRAVQAYDLLHYPLSATMALADYPTGLGAKHEVRRSVEYIRANDQSHWCRERPGLEARYVSGSTLVVYSAKTKAYRRPDTNKAELREVFGVMTGAIDELRWLLSDAKMKPVLSSASVTASTMGGENVYVIRLSPRVGSLNEFTIGKRDSIIRRLRAVYVPVGVQTWTIRIERKSRPFPKSTFVRPFSGPPGRVMPATTEPPTPPGPPIK